MQSIHFSPFDLGNRYGTSGTDDRGGADHAAERTPPAGDRLSLRALSVADVLSLLNERLDAALRGHFGETAAPRAQAHESEPTPAAVAARAVQAAHQLMNSQGATVAQLRSAVDQGFAEARELLATTGADQAAAALEASYDLMQQGLARLGGGAIYSGYESLERRQTSAIQIETREGDIVTIEFDRRQSAENTRFYADDGQTALLASSARQDGAAAMRFQVKGDLNDDERAAINQLVETLDGISDKLAEGDLEAIAAETANLHLDSSVLSGFTARIHYAERYRSVETYGQSRPMANTPATDAALTANMRSELRPALEHGLLKDPHKALLELLSFMLEEKGVSPDKSLGHLLDSTTRTKEVEHDRHSHRA